MKIYLAHNFEARFILKQVVEKFEKHGHEITSTWILDDMHVAGKMSRLDSAVVDLQDIDRAETLILFLNSFEGKTGKGKWFEYGYAVAKGKRVILVGDDVSCVFTHLPEIERVGRLEDVFLLLR